MELITTVIILFFAAVAAYALYRTLYGLVLKMRGTRATGVIVHMHVIEDDESGATYLPTIAYTDSGGRQITGRPQNLDLPRGVNQAGDKVKVVYHPQHPDRFWVYAGAANEIKAVLITLVVSTAFLYLAWAALSDLLFG